MSARRAITITGAAAYHLLKLTHESSDVLPPLKSVAGGALYITDLVVKFRTSKQEWKEFGTYVQDIVATIIDSLGTVDLHHDQPDIIEKLQSLKVMLAEVQGTIEAKQSQRFGSRMRHFLRHPYLIAELKKQVDHAVALFKFDLAVKTEIKVDKTLKIAENNSQQCMCFATNLESKAEIRHSGGTVSRTALDALLNKLRYVEGASWDPRRVCLANTRHHIIEQVLSWVENADGSHTTNVLLLTGVAGAGKSTVAHTVGKHYAGTKQLATSFFFDRETTNRNNPRHLISTIAADICRTNDQLAARITSVIERDGRIASAPISRQFEELVLGPCKEFSAERPLVIILDALDEGYDDDLLWILGEASRLPRHFCFFVTSRIFPDLEVLRQKSHVHLIALNIHTQESIDDMRVFIPNRLRHVAEHHTLGSSWPDQKLLALFTAKAEGLPLWVSTVCDYLRTRSDPTAELHKLVSATHRSSRSAESKLDKLYRTILETCNWDDESFVDDYHRLMGAAIATKTPLTLGALGNLYQLVPVISSLARRQLSPLLAGLGGDTDQPVRPLHKSLRDFLTLRAFSPISVENHIFAIEERIHSQILAMLCLSELGRGLNTSIPGVGYLADDVSVAPGIPTVSENHVSEELSYACRFWIDHLLDVDLPLSPPMLKQLKGLLAERLILWMEVVAMNGRFEGLSRLQNWVKEQAMEEGSLALLVFNESQGPALRSLSGRLDYMGRLEEALTAARDGVQVYRGRIEKAPSESREGLFKALNTLSVRLYKLGYHEEALNSAEEGVKLGRQLVLEQPEVLTPNLACSLHELSVNLSRLGRHEEALKATEEAVGLQRQLASERPAAFTPDLSNSIHSLSIRLASFGRHKEALEAIEEAVKLRRQLANEQPAVFTSDLANSVHQLSINLASFGRYEEALEAIEEVVKLRRQLASERPAAFTSDLANSIHSLSIQLASKRRHKEALEAIEEAVKLRRQLASERPAAFTSDLANSVHARSVYLSNFGRHKEALEGIEEAVKLRRQLASERPAAFTSDLASSVHQLSVHLYNLGRHEEALNASEEAAELKRQLASERPEAFTPGLAGSLYDLAINYNHRGCHQKALATIKESAELYHSFAERYPARYGTKYSKALRLVEKYSVKAELIRQRR